MVARLLPAPVAPDAVALVRSRRGCRRRFFSPSRLLQTPRCSIANGSRGASAEVKYAVWLVVSASAPRNFMLVGRAADMPDALADHVADFPVSRSQTIVQPPRKDWPLPSAGVHRWVISTMTSERMSSVGLTRHAGRTEPISILDTVPLTPSIDHFPGRLAGRVGPHEAQGGKKRVGRRRANRERLRTSAVRPRSRPRKTWSRSELRRHFTDFACVIAARAFGETSGHCQVSVSTDRFDTSDGKMPRSRNAAMKATR